MTGQEAIALALKETRGVLEAVAVASRSNGKPILHPQTGQPLNFRAPSIGDLLMRVLANQEIILQLQGFTMQVLAGGFKLDDSEVGRIAEALKVKFEASEVTPKG